MPSSIQPPQPNRKSPSTMPLYTAAPQPSTTSGDDQHRRESERRRAAEDTARDALEEDFLDTEKNFRKIMGYKDLWMLDAVLNPTATAEPKVA